MASRYPSLNYSALYRRIPWIPNWQEEKIPTAKYPLKQLEAPQIINFAVLFTCVGSVAVMGVRNHQKLLVTTGLTALAMFLLSFSSFAKGEHI